MLRNAAISVSVM